MQVVDAFEGQDLSLRHLADSFLELTRYIGVMQGRAFVMYKVIPVVPAGFVVRGIDAVDRVIFRKIGVYERVLGPVAQHHHNTGKYKGDDKNKQGDRPVVPCHQRAENIKGDLARRKTHVEFFSIAAKEIKKGIAKSQHQKTEHVLHKTQQTIALVAQSAAGILFHIVLNMVHSHMMGKIGFGGMAKKRTYYPNDPVLQEASIFLK